MAACTFGITYDYLCPFARNANEHIVEGLRGGADWDVQFVAYSQAQGAAAADGVGVWDGPDPLAASGVLALAAGLMVREHQPGHFLDAHTALFAARHDEALDIRQRDVIADVLTRQDVDVADVFARIDGGEALALLRKEHEWAVDAHDVWGVPTFMAGGRAVFVRLLSRPEGNPGRARFEIERIVDLVANVSSIHEFKQTDLPD